MNDAIAIKVEHLSKTFKLPHERISSIKGALINFARRQKGYEVQHVLDDISFEVKKGEFFGIVGRNGSGKSTLLKILAGIYYPTKGSVQINGKLTPFIELGVGFSPELTGRENVFLNGSLLGFNREEMTAMYDDIVAFAELERFMDQKLKNYSSGMQVRLAFSIAIRANAPILLLDEVLAVGDEAFQRKCYDYFESLRRNNKTVIIVTHDMGAVEKFCTRAILIEAGHIISEGLATKVARAYSDMLNPTTNNYESTVVDKESIDNKRFGDMQLSFSGISVNVEDPGKYNSNISINATVTCNNTIDDQVVVAYALKDSLGQKLFGNKVISTMLANMKPGEMTNVAFTFPNILCKGHYFLDLSLYIPQRNLYTDCWIDCAEFITKVKGVNGYPVVVEDKFMERPFVKERY